MKICFIVNGTETYVSCKATDKLADVWKRALEQTGNTGRPWSDFQCIFEDTTLRADLMIKEQKIYGGKKRDQLVPAEIKNEDVIFLSLKAGQGACNLIPDFIIGDTCYRGL